MPEPITLSVPAGEGGAVRIEWDSEGLGNLSDAASAPAWSIDTPIAWDAIAAVRLLSAEFDDGSLLALAAVRPVSASGHGDEAVEAVLRRKEGDDAELEQVLLSTEYGPTGEPTRVGVELHLSDEDMPLRVAGDAQGGRSVTEDAMPRSVTELTMRLGGTEGRGALEILRAT
jgi:hypothetical protein